MQKFLTTMVLATSLVAIHSAKAVLIGGPDIIAAPASVIDDAPGAENDHQQAFDERQGVNLLAALNVDGGSIAAGTIVDSHMIFLNTHGGAAATDTETWTFGGNILGVMSNRNGSLEVNSSSILGAIGTVYPGAAFAARGLESNDHYAVSGSQITVKMSVTQPGDWIRVVTASKSVPDGGATFCLFGLGLAAIGLARRR